MLQVLTGSAKGRKLKVPKGRKIRPMTSRVKKSVFDTLGDIGGLTVLDVFAGSGSLGIEALSRGASSVTFVEKDNSVFRILSENVSLCGFQDRATFYRSDYALAFKKLSSEAAAFDLIFLDPPYPLYESMGVSDLVLDAAMLLNSDGRIIIEHNYNKDEDTPGLNRVTKSFGGTFVSYFEKRDT